MYIELKNPYPGSTFHAAATVVSPADIPGGSLSAVDDYPSHPTFLIDCNAAVLSLNAAALRLVSAGSCVVISGGLLSAADPALTQGWRSRLQSVIRSGKPCTVRVPEGVKSRTVAFLPSNNGVLIRFEREQACDAAAIESFAFGCGLTASETGVLIDLAIGMGAKEIALKSNRSELTVRSHFKKILKKTQTESARELTSVLSRLPPVA